MRITTKESRAVIVVFHKEPNVTTDRYSSIFFEVEYELSTFPSYSTLVESSWFVHGSWLLVATKIRTLYE